MKTIRDLQSDQPRPEKVARVAADTLRDLDRAVPDQPANVVALAPPARTTLPYPVQAVCDGLPIRQDDDQDDLLAFTIHDDQLPAHPTFYIKRDHVSVSGLAIKYAQTKCDFIERLYCPRVS